ncbi:hypothetical protein [Salinibacter altiplanensis]|uniref:hypothetical protein n=1 Tax=Salinibacter altiplanensis TaxID=1803181 RepID=UPI000C9F3F57|nr:hypothetical protein [Salinibacter altiplanensis]
MRRTFVLLLLVFVGLPTLSVKAQVFSSSNIQVLYGDGFEDWYYGGSTESGRQTTVTFQHLADFKSGDVFFFADLARGTYVDAAGEPIGKDYRVYSELAARFSPLGAFGARPDGFVSDVLVASQMNRDGNGFAAHMIGAGVDLEVPGFTASNVNVYYRDDVFNSPTYQVTTVWKAVWESPFSISPLRLTFSGFVDVYGTDHDGADFHTQPQFLVGTDDLPIEAGLELYYHSNSAINVRAPQVLLKWTM